MVQLLKKRINAIHVYFKALVVHNKQIQIEVCPPMLFKKVLTTASRYKLMSMRKIIIHIESDKIDDEEAVRKVANVIAGGRISKTKKWIQYCFMTTWLNTYVYAAPKHTRLTDTFKVGIKQPQNGR